MENLNWAERNIQSVGEEGFRTLQEARVVVLGLGGVGSFAAEALARSGVGTLVLIDGDRVDATNINRQLPALESTLGALKTEVMGERINNMGCGTRLTLYAEFYKPGDGPRLIGHPDFVVDCIDDYPAKEDIVRWCNDEQIPLLVSGCCGRRKDPQALKIRDLCKTENDPLLRRLRRAFRDEKVQGVKALYSTEKALPAGGKGLIPSMIFVPASAGLLLASECVSSLLQAASNR